MRQYRANTRSKKGNGSIPVQSSVRAPASTVLSILHFSTKPDTSYFEQYSQVHHPASTISPRRIETSGPSGENRKQKRTKIERDVHLGKHKTKKRRETLENVSISRSLALALQTGKLPSLFEQRADDDTINDYYQTTPLSSRVDDLGINIDLSKPDEIPEYREPSPPPRSDVLQDPYKGLGVAANWFPGHMKKAIDQIGERIKNVSVSIEVRDARIPLSSANPMLDALTRDKIRIIVLNKADLVANPQKVLNSTAQVMGFDVEQLHWDKSLHPTISKEYQTLRSSSQQSPIPSPPKRNLLNDTTPSFAAGMKKKSRGMGESSIPMIQSLTDLKPNPKLEEWFTSLLKEHASIVSLPPSLIEVPHIISHDRKQALLVTNGKSSTTIRSLLTLIRVLSPKRRFASVPTAAIVCGFPNVGKSTLINGLKVAARMAMGHDKLENWGWSINVPSSKAKVGPTPGVTRHVQGFRVSQHPPIVILDTPGIMVPRFDKSSEGVATSYKLALVQCISDKIADPKLQCEHLLEFLNKMKQYQYTTYYGLPLNQPCTHLPTLLLFIARKEELVDSGIEKWRETMMVSRFGKVLPRNVYQEKILTSRLREQQDGIGLPSLVSEYEKKTNTKVNLSDLTSIFFSRDELTFELSPELEEQALRSLLKSFRTGKLGKFTLD